MNHRYYFLVISMFALFSCNAARLQHTTTREMNSTDPSFSTLSTHPGAIYMSTSGKQITKGSLSGEQKRQTILSKLQAKAEANKAANKP